MTQALRLISVIALFSCLGFTLVAQQRKLLKVEDIWASREYAAKRNGGFNWYQNGQSYTDLDELPNGGKAIVLYSISTGKATDTLLNTKKLSQSPDFDDYYFGNNGNLILLRGQAEQIYRRSSTAKYSLYNNTTKSVSVIANGTRIGYATISPDGKNIAYTRDNNLFVQNLGTLSETAVTTNGKLNEIINGSTDWVYEEEFSFAQAFFWNTDGTKLAFYTFNEKEVPVYNMQKWGKLYPEDYKYKYPKAGEKNSEVSISVYDLKAAKSTLVDIGNEKDHYIARINWTESPNVLSLRRMNRLQNKLELLHADAQTGKTSLILEEKSDTYIDINDDLTYLPGNREFIFSSEKDGFKHLYLYDITGKLVRQITSGNWEIDDFFGINPKNGLLYFTGTEAGSAQRQLYSIETSGKNKKQITKGAGTHRIGFAPALEYYTDEYSDANTPPVFTLADKTGKTIRTLEDNAGLKEKLQGLALGKKEFFDFKTSEGNNLKGWMIKPSDFDPNKKYPVLMYVYGGPGDQRVIDAYGGTDYLWFQLLTQKGYIVVSVDGRGTGGRGAAFKKSTYANLGKLETQDQIEAAKYLATQPYVIKERIGIWGWSFGGYMTALCMTKGADFFKAGISVAPVTNWRFYDSIYTERFLKTPQENAAGYDDNSPVKHASKLKGKFLLVHGTGDDNVHFQNAVAMEDALIAANKQFDSFYYPNRNHGIYGGYTRLHLYNMMTEFLLKNL